MAKRKVAQQNRKASGWQAECQQINSIKAKRKRRQTWRKRIVLTITLTVLANMGLAGWWLWQSSEVARLQEAAANWASRQIAQAGFTVKFVSVSGLEHLKPNDVMLASGIQNGTPIFWLSLAEVKATLEEHPHILRAQIERELPNKLSIEITEREPVAIWQHKGNQHWLDAEGKLLTKILTKPDADTPVLVLTGKDAPTQMVALQQLLDAAPSLKERVTAAQWVGQRRWNLWLKGGMKVMLPGEAAIKRWHQFAELEQTYQLSERAVDTMDLRLVDKVFVRYKPEVDKQERMTTDQLVTAWLDVNQ